MKLDTFDGFVIVVVAAGIIGELLYLLAMKLKPDDSATWKTHGYDVPIAFALYTLISIIVFTQLICEHLSVTP